MGVLGKSPEWQETLLLLSLCWSDQMWPYPHKCLPLGSARASRPWIVYWNGTGVFQRKRDQKKEMEISFQSFWWAIYTPNIFNRMWNQNIIYEKKNYFSFESFDHLIEHFMCVCVLSRFSYVCLFATPWTVACQAPLSMELSRQEYWSGSPAIPSSRGSSQPRGWTHISYVSGIGRWVLHH